jgi:uncharacterized protein with GYD domain
MHAECRPDCHSIDTVHYRERGHQPEQSNTLCATLQRDAATPPQLDVALSEIRVNARENPKFEKITERLRCASWGFGSTLRMYTCRDLRSPKSHSPEVKNMPNFLLQVSYTADALKKLIAKPQDRGEAVRKMLEKLGGSVTGTWLSFGDYDIVSLLEVPDNVTAASFALAVAAGGSVKAIKTTPLLSMDEGLAALKKAGSSPYKAIGEK